MRVELEMDELRDAWFSILEDARHFRFVVHPYEILLVNEDRESWLAAVQRDVRDGTYAPEVPDIADIPKGKGLVRPGSLLSLRDQVVYATLVGRCLGSIARVITTLFDSIDYAHRLRRPVDRRNWLKHWFKDWEDFVEASVSRANVAPNIWVLETDIAGFYENIDLALLESDLIRAGCRAADAAALREFLTVVSDEKHRGLPQGYRASDILGKLYLHSVDQELLDEGYEHCRYSDDIRVFTENEVSAKAALLKITQLLRARSLIPQSAKTSIRPAHEVTEAFQGFKPEIQRLDREYRNKSLEAVDIQYHGHYSLRDTMEALRDLDAIPVEVLREAFIEHILIGDYDKTLFHYLLKRLGNEHDGVAIDFCVAAFELYPQETEYIVNYLKKVRFSEQHFAMILRFLESPAAMYEYQNYVITKWLTDERGDRIPDRERLLKIVRGYAFGRYHESYLRSQARACLAMHGTATDIDRIQRDFARAESVLERSEIIVSVRRQEFRRREAFYDTAIQQGDLCRRALSLVRRLRAGIDDVESAS
jgi:hypothetical protein